MTINKPIIPILVAALLAAGSNYSASAALLSADDPRYGADKLTLDTSTGLAWLDLPVTCGLSYQQVLAGTQPGGAFAGFTFATLNQVSALFDGAGIPKSGFYPESGTSMQPILSVISLLGATSSQDNHPEIFGLTGTQGAHKDAHLRAGLDFLYENGVPGYARLPEGFTEQGDSYSTEIFGAWLVQPIPEPTPAKFVALSALLLLARGLTMRRYKQSTPEVAKSRATDLWT